MLTGEIRNQIDRIWDAFWSGGISNPLEVIEQITYLLFLRFQLMRCAYDAKRYAEECSLVRATLEKRAEPHWKEFLSLWKT